jgi:hypothetical protein
MLIYNSTNLSAETYEDGVWVEFGGVDPLIYKGVIACAGNPNYPAADAGHLYKISTAGKIGGASGKVVEVGDMALCNTDGTASGDEAAVGTKWDVIQSSTEAVIGPASATADAIVLFNSTTGKVVKDSTKTIVTTLGTVDTTVPTCKAVDDVTSLKAPIASPTFTGVATAPTFDTGVLAAGVTLAGTTLAADGTTADIDVNVTPKGTGSVVMSKVDINAGTIDAVTIAETTALKFGLTPTVAGTPDNGSIYWKATEETATIQLHPNVALPLGQKDMRMVYNPSASATIARGAAVYTNGVGGTPTIVTVALAQANSATTYDVLGLAAEDILPLTQGFIIVRGHLGELDTSGYDGAAGASLYLSATTPGAVTSIVPDAPNFEVRVGRLIVKNAVGKVNVRITKAYSLDNLTDVQVPAPAAGQLLKYDGVSWVAADSATVVSAGGTDFFLTDSDSDIEGMTRAVACVVTWTGHGLATGALVKFEGITQAGWTALNSPLGNANVFHTITYINVNSFSIPVNTSGYAGDYVPATDQGTISSGKIFNTPDTTITTQTDLAESTNSVEALIDSYCTPLPLGRTSITAGEWLFKTWCYASSLTDTNTVVIRVYKRSAAGTEALLFFVETADLTTTNTLSQISSVRPEYTILATDHLVFKYFAKSNRTVGQYRTCYITHNGTTNYSYVKTPLALGHASLGQLAYADAGHTGFAPANPLATDTLWDAAGDLVVGTGDNTAGKLSKGDALQVLRVKSDGSTLEFANPAAASGDVSTDTLWDAAGDLVIGTGSHTAHRLAPGATTTILVGGGAADPVWTTATGTGAPVRAGSPTFTGTVTSPTTETGVPEAGLRLTAITLSALGSDADIDINITPKGAGEVNLPKVDINAGTIDGATIATSDITVGSGKTLNVSAGTLTLAAGQIGIASLTGVAPANPLATDTLWDAAGDLVVGTGANAAHRLAAGATTTILKGGGAADPVWTTVTGTGAPVCAVSPTLTGTPTAPTAAEGTNTAQLATCAFVQTSVLDETAIGVSWKSDAASPTLTQINEFYQEIKVNNSDWGRHATFGRIRRCTLSDTGTVNHYYGDPGVSLTSFYDGTDGQVMVEFPKFWYSVSVSGVYYRWLMSPVAKTGWKIHPMFFHGPGLTTIFQAAANATAGGGASVLCDTGRAWSEDALIGKYVHISEGTGAGDSRKITDNDDTTITVSAAFSGTPDATSVYRIDNPNEYGMATSGAATTLTNSAAPWTASAMVGMYVHIMAGTGIGQQRVILSNTTDTITVDTWTVNPDNTSVYEISVLKEKVYISAFEGSFAAGSPYKLQSIANVALGVSQTLTVFRTRAQARNADPTARAVDGAGWQLLDENTRNGFNLICMIRDATLNSQATYLGITDATNTAAVKTGFTSSINVGTGYVDLGNSSGEATEQGIAGKRSFSRFGVENWFGNVWKWVDGIHVAVRRQYIANRGYYDVTSVPGTIYPYIDTTLTGNNGDGYQVSLANPTATAHNSLMVCTGVTSGSNTTYLCDYYNHTEDVNRALLFGGSWYHAGYAGAFYFLANNAASASDAYVGGRFAFK